MSSDAVDDVGNSMGLTPTDLTGFPGAPFTQAEVDAAVVTVQNAAKWHIAPEIEDTIVLDVQCLEPVLRLPTRHLVSVDEIRDADSDTVLAAATYRVSAPDIGQVRKKFGYWPGGYGRVEVDFTHGFEDVPKDLLGVLAQAAVMSRRDQTAKSQTAGPFSVAFDIAFGSTDTNPLSSGAVFTRYALWQPGIA